MRRYRVVVMGASTGGIEALQVIMSNLKADLSLSILIVQHTSPHSENYIVEILRNATSLRVKEAEEKEKIEKGCIYIAPPNYHMLIEKNETISFDSGEKVCFSRPSIDVLFESAAEIYRDNLVGIVLTGGNSDGAMGLKYIKKCGGLAIVQEPKTASMDIMPNKAIKTGYVDHILSLENIAQFLNTL